MYKYLKKAIDHCWEILFEKISQQFHSFCCWVSSTTKRNFCSFFFCCSVCLDLFVHYFAVNFKYSSNFIFKLFLFRLNCLHYKWCDVDLSLFAIDLVVASVWVDVCIYLPLKALLPYPGCYNRLFK